MPKLNEFIASKKGYGSGYGNGDGFGDGSGDGSGYGSGYGDGYGEQIAIAGGYAVEVVRKFGVVKVGCQVHTIAEWLGSWEKIASSNSVNITQTEVDAIMSLAEAR